jgi:hypothetical protein
MIERWAAIVAIALAGCGSTATGAKPSLGLTSPEAAVRGFMQAVSDSDITRMTQLWGNEQGPAAETGQPQDFEKRMLIAQAYLRGSILKSLKEDIDPADPSKRTVTLELDRGRCTRTVPVDVVKTNAGSWIVTSIDLNMAGTPSRPCPSKASQP